MSCQESFESRVTVVIESLGMMLVKSRSSFIVASKCSSNRILDNQEVKMFFFVVILFVCMSMYFFMVILFACVSVCLSVSMCVLVDLCNDLGGGWGGGN